jgi:hypothetical protein
MACLDWKSEAPRDGHPPFTEREREIHLNGTSGVKFCEGPGSIAIQAFFFNGSKRRTLDVQHPILNSEGFLVEHWVLSVERWAF